MAKQYIQSLRTLTHVTCMNLRCFVAFCVSASMWKKAMVWMVCLMVASCASSNSVDRQSPTEIIVIGTTHAETADYSSLVLQQMLDRVRPSVILYEVDSSFFDSDGRLKAQYRDGQEGKAVWLYHLNTGVPIEPYEMEGRNQYYEKTNYFAREAAFSEKLSALFERGQLTPKSTAQLTAVLASFDLRDTCSNAKPEFINSPVCDAIVRKKHYYMYEVLRSVAEENEGLHEFTDFLTEAAAFWKIRNDAMAANIIAHAKNRLGQRIVVITGFEHRPELLDRLHSQANDLGYLIREFQP